MSKKKKDLKVAILGMAPSRIYAPWDNPDWEFWRINEAYRIDQFYNRETRADRWFQLHQYWDFTRKLNRSDYEHWDWLQEEHDFPIYMQEEFEEVPSAVQFPLDEIIEYFECDENTRYFTNTLSMLVPFAMYEGATDIGIFGWELASTTERMHEKPSAEFWLGVAHGRGVRIHIPPGCQLLGQTKRIYAFEDVPAVNRMHMESRLNTLHRQQSEIYRKIDEAHTNEEKTRLTLTYTGLGGAISEVRREIDELDDVMDPRGEKPDRKVDND